MYGGTRLGSDGYIRPKYTTQDKLTDEEIQEKLKFYKRVEDIQKVPLSTHLRYFTIGKDDSYNFRLGGNLFRADGLPDYVILTNGGRNWSVQAKNAIFFSKMTTEEIGIKINELEKENKELKKNNEALKSTLKEVKKENKSLKRKLKEY